MSVAYDDDCNCAIAGNVLRAIGTATQQPPASEYLSVTSGALGKDVKLAAKGLVGPRNGAPNRHPNRHPNCGPPSTRAKGANQATHQYCQYRFKWCQREDLNMALTLSNAHLADQWINFPITLCNH